MCTLDVEWTNSSKASGVDLRSFFIIAVEKAGGTSRIAVPNARSLFMEMTRFASKWLLAPPQAPPAVPRRRSMPPVRAGGKPSGKTAVSRHVPPPQWSTDTCLRTNERTSLKEGEKLT